MSAYLFVHFREKTTPDGEQVYFALSRDGFHFDAVNDGRPVLWAYFGEKGVRDHTIVRNVHDGRYHIISTDLSLAYGMRGRFEGSWDKISSEGSQHLSIWSSDNLVDWTEQRLIKVASDTMGCAWAPDIIYDRHNEDYLLHWSSSLAVDNYQKKSIYYSRTKDFKTFTEPACLYEKDDCGVIDSAMYEEDEIYYLLVKSELNPPAMILLKSSGITGPWERVDAFDRALVETSNGLYEAPTALRTADGRVCLFLDFYGAKGADQGYVPFVATDFKTSDFKRFESAFSFPYGFKHGTILEIEDSDYDRIMAYQFDQDDYSSY